MCMHIKAQCHLVGKELFDRVTDIHVLLTESRVRMETIFMGLDVQERILLHIINLPPHVLSEK
jgi:hypothetical protein